MTVEEAIEIIEALIGRFRQSQMPLRDAIAALELAESAELALSVLKREATHDRR